MNKKNLKTDEFKNFSQLSSEWWDPNGKFKILHQILPLRMEYILNSIDSTNINNLNVLDLGCGGGLTCESFARLGANITGIDFIKKNIEIAKLHSKQSNLNINYIYGDLDDFSIKKKYDIILLLEVVEHLDDWESLINKIKKNLKPKGTLIISTINRNIISKIFAIFVAENILKWVPKNTHDYNKLITPKELKKTLIKNNFKIKNLVGMNFNPITNEWKLNKNLLNMNYFCTANLI